MFSVSDCCAKFSEQRIGFRLSDSRITYLLCFVLQKKVPVKTRSDETNNSLLSSGECWVTCPFLYMNVLICTCASKPSETSCCHARTYRTEWMNNFPQIIFASAVAVALTAPQNPEYLAETLSDERQDNGDGNFRYSFQTSNDISASQVGTPGILGQSNVQGSFR